MSEDDIHNGLSSKCLFPKSHLDVIQDFSMSGIVFIQDISELEVRRPKTVTEVLCEYPSSI